MTWFKSELLHIINARLFYRNIKYFLRAFYLGRRNKCIRKTVRIKDSIGFVSSGPITSYKHEENTITLPAEQSTIEIAFLENNLLKINVQRSHNPGGMVSYSLSEHRPEFKNPEIVVTDSNDSILIHSSGLRVIIRKQDSRLSIYDSNGTCRLEELSSPLFYRNGSIRWQFKHDAATSYHGLGERAAGFNLNGGKYELWNTDPSLYDRGDDPLYLNVPFLFMMRNGSATGLFIDNSFRSSFDINSKNTGTVEYNTAGGELCAYIMTGTPAEVIQHYTSLTGRMKMPPLWALGYHQSRWSYYPQNRVLEIAGEFRKRKLPCDVIHIDIDYMDGYRCFTWDKKRFPEPREMINTLHKQGFKVLTMIDPGIKVDPEYHVYREGIEKDVFIKYPDGTRFTGPVWPGDCHFPDFTDPEVREWWGDFYKELLDDGIDAFWNDMNEIALITFLTGTTIPDCIRHSFEGKGAEHSEMHNYYGVLMARASTEGIQKLRSGKRPFVLSRSGWAGLQRYAVNWTGDNRSTWDHLRLSVSMVLNLGLSGIAFTGPDIGGFAGNPTPELFARWMQLGTFLPFFRTHTMKGSPDQEPWSFGDEVESICKKYLELRYRLLPYLYTTVWQAHEKGLPIVRPLRFMYPEDSKTYNIDDQYLFGDNMLVAPVVNKGQRARPVYLPEGDDWYDFWHNQKYPGGNRITVEAPLDTLPVFVREGSVITCWPVQQFTGEKEIDALELFLYWSAKYSVSWLYEDDGETLDYVHKSKYCLTRLVLNGSERGTLDFETVNPEMPSHYKNYKIEPIGLPPDIKKIITKHSRSY